MREPRPDYRWAARKLNQRFFRIGIDIRFTPIGGGLCRVDTCTPEDWALFLEYLDSRCPELRHAFEEAREER